VSQGGIWHGKSLAPATATEVINLETENALDCSGVFKIQEECSMSEDDLKAELERLRAENDQLKNKSVRGLSLKVSEKGAVSLYGVGRFPVTLYKEQWAKVLGMKDDIEKFLHDNAHLLKTKE
jgi:hypothetical protein